MVASRSEKLLVRGDAQAIDLRVGMVDCPLTDARERFPEPGCRSVRRKDYHVVFCSNGPDGMVIAR